MKTQVHESHHPRRLIRILVAILLAATVAAVVMAWMPSSIEAAHVDLVLVKLQVPMAKPANRRAHTSTASTSGNARVRMKCAECGVDVSTAETGQLGGGVDRGAVVGLVGGAVMPKSLRGDVRSHALRTGERRGGN